MNVCFTSCKPIRYVAKQCVMYAVLTKSEISASSFSSLRPISYAQDKIISANYVPSEALPDLYFIADQCIVFALQDVIYFTP